MRIEDDHKHFVARCNHIRQRLPADLIPIAARKLAAFFRKPSQVFNSLFVVRRRTGKKSLAVKNSHFPPQPDKVLHKTDVRDFLIADGVPDHIRNNIVLAVSIVIAELRIPEFVSGKKHGSAAAAHENRTGIFAVRIVMLMVVTDQIVQRHAVMYGQIVNRAPYRSAARTENVA